MNIPNLKPFDTYLICLDRLHSSYKQTESEFSQSKWEIEWCGESFDHHIKHIQSCYDSLKGNFSNFKKIYTKISNTYSSLTEYEKNIFNENKSIYKNAKNLLDEMSSYLSINNLYNL